MIHEPQFSRLMAKVLSGEASREEQLQMEEWVGASEENKKLKELSEAAWQGIETEDLMQDADAVFNNIEGQIDQVEPLPDQPAGIWFRKQLAWVAAASVVLLCGLWMYLGQVSDPAGIAQAVQHHWVQKSNAPGEKSRVILSDGTVVWLNSESTLSYKKPFGQGNNRYVELEGEAYFDVAHDPQHPFSVKTGNITTTALGTSFNITAYEEDSFIDVDLQSGKVLVSLAEPMHEDQVFIEPGEKVRFDKVENAMEKSSFDPLHDLAWKDGVISFRNATFDEVVTKLSRWYGVRFDVKNKPKELKEWNYTAKFKGAYLDNILSGIGFTKNFEYLIEGEDVTLTFKPAPMTQ